MLVARIRDSRLADGVGGAGIPQIRISRRSGVMHASGEGKWTVEEALEVQAAVPIITMSVMMRYRSMQDDSFSGKVSRALRNEFGGHAVEKAQK